MKTYYYPAGWLSLAVGCFLAAGCQSHGPKFDPHASRMGDGAAATVSFTSLSTNRIKAEWLQPPCEPFRLGPGDHVELEIIGREGTLASTFVCPDGKIYYDLLPGVDVWGMTLDEARQALAKGLSKFYSNPQLSFSLQDIKSKRVWVLGRLNRSGIYPLTGPTTIIEAISKAGGLFTSRFTGTTEELADLNHSFIVRNGELLPVNFQKLLRSGDTAQNIYLQPDDFIYLPSTLSSQVYVLGAVNSPRPIGFMDRMSLSMAVAKALGTQAEAQLTQVAIVRGSMSEPKIAIVDLKAILTGRAPDVMLEARDIVYVPFSPYRTLERYAKLITDTFARTVAANEGGHAVRGSSFGGIGVSSPIQH